jgi:N,N-dimethylformamidase beta subunit-like protein/uncharacterized protein DUF4082/fibronectin type III domain protein/Big-like domain-containing protein
MHLSSSFTALAAHRRRTAALSALTLALVLAMFASFGSARALAACANPVACENAQAGDAPADWNVKAAGDSTIQGFATQISVTPGQTEQFKISTPSTSYHIDILRLGYYGGKGARIIQANIKPSVTLPQTQPACQTFSATGLIDCGNWAVSATWTVPSTAVSGVYIAHLVRDDSKDPGGDSQIQFVVRNDSSHSDVLVATSDATWEAYNDYGGNSLYTCSVACPSGNPLAYKAAYAVSYNRPFDGAEQTDGGASDPYYAEYQMIYWLEENGYDVSYVSDVDLDRNPSLLLNHKVFISNGHDEYWSANERAGVENAVAHGVNAAFFSGNEVFWKTRWANSSDGTNTPYRTLVTYKETHFNAATDPLDPTVWTGAWGDSRFSPPADGGKPANALTGQQFVVNSGSGDIAVPYQYSKLRIWRNTPVAKLTTGQSLTLGPGDDMLGYEWDVDADNGYRPAGEFDLSQTTLSGLQSFTDYGSTTASNTSQTHHLSLYRAPSGALVFGAGTVQWSWGLDDVNMWQDAGPPAGARPDPAVQQATVNLFADMGAQPTTLMSGLTAATKSTDTTPPTSTITSPTTGASLQDNNTVTVTGNATDTGGGIVAGVEVSTDGGKTWHPAAIQGADGASVTWKYTWPASGYPTTSIESRAVDDSGNLESPTDATSVNVNCPCTLWSTSQTPGTPDAGDTTGIEVGVKFQSTTYGQITGLRFYKSSLNTGTHIGSIWTSSGQLLTQATFSSETASGWQTVSFSQPVTVVPNTTYVAAYLAPNGHESGDDGYFYPAPSPFQVGGADYSSPPLSAVSNSSSVNGLYSYSSTSTFPSNTFSAANYWVDPIFVPIQAPGQVTNVTGTPGFDSVSLSWSAPSSGGAPTQYTITPYIGSTAQTPVNVTGTPPATSTTITGLQQGTPYTFTVQASNPSGNGTASAPSSAITPSGPMAPGAPTGVSAIPASSKAQVSWTAPPNNGSAITSYTITPWIGSTPQTPTQTLNGSATSATVSGLNNGSAYTFTVSATNSLGTGTASAASAAVTPEDTLHDFGTPATIDSGDAGSGTLGVKFTADTSGTITGIRFYKASTNTGTHVGSLWSSSGSLLASATFTNETGSGWQTVLFSNPVTINPGTTYVASYFAPGGHYSFTPAALYSQLDNAPLHALATGTTGNGVYNYGSANAFPTSTYNASDYWVDVLFNPSVPGQVTGVTATAGRLAATVSWTAPGGGGATSYIVTPYIGTTAQTPTTVTGNPPATTATISGLQQGTAYTFTVQAANAQGKGAASAASNSVTPLAPTAPSAPTAVTATPASAQAQVSWTAPAANGSAITGYTITPYTGTTAQTPTQVSNGSATSATVNGLTNGTSYTFTVAATNSLGTGPASAATSATTPADTVFDFATPTTVDSADPTSIELGVKFTSDTTGTITGIRFYKASTNTGTHIGSLWSSTGSLLASATFTNETGSGWQTVLFSSPVTINPGTTYVAGYLAPNGHYSFTQNGLASAVDNPPLHAVSDNVSADGLYSYSATSTMPTSSYQSGNYYVDVLFQPAPPAQVTGVSATAGIGSATVSWTAVSGATSYVVTPYIGSTAQTATNVNGGSTTSTTVNGLTAGTAYTFKVQAVNANGTGPASAASNSVTPLTSATPSAPTGVSATPATGQAQVSWTAPAANGSAITGYTITPYIGATAQAPTQISNGSATSGIVTGLTTGTAYTFTVSATNSVGTGPASAASSALTPEDTIFDFGTPATADSGDTSGVNLGVTFTADSNGQVMGIRFYKAATNTGTHVGALWSSTGTLLASASFTGESSSGWQTVMFSTPVSVTAGTTYVASYFAPSGHYSVTAAGFNTAFDNPPLHAVANGTSPNGLYLYGSASAFPTNSFNASNYWVDVLFAPTS